MFTTLESLRWNQNNKKLGLNFRSEVKILFERIGKWSKSEHLNCFNLAFKANFGKCESSHLLFQTSVSDLISVAVVRT